MKPPSAQHWNRRRRPIDKKAYYTIAAAVLIVLLFVYSYFAFYRTATANIQTAKQQLQSEKALVAALEQQAGAEVDQPSVATGALQTKVPVKPMSEKLMLDFEKAELLSDSLILSIAFTEGEEEALPATAAPAAEETASEGPPPAQEPAEPIESEENGEEAEPEAPPLPEEVLPAGIRKIRADMTVESPGYEEMETFIQTLENQMRLLKIEQLTFTGPQEAQKLAGDSEPLSYQVTVAAYYMPELTDLLEDSPEIDAPDPANKKNPFVVIER